MLYFNRIYASEGIDLNKTSASKESDISYYWYFEAKAFKFHYNVCNRCHDALMISINLNGISILNIRGVDYHCIIKGTSKKDAVNVLKNAY